MFSVFSFPPIIAVVDVEAITIRVSNVTQPFDRIELTPLTIAAHNDLLRRQNDE